MNGGYVLLDLKGSDIEALTEEEIKQAYDVIYNSYTSGKPLIIQNMTYSDTLYKNVKLVAQYFNGSVYGDEIISTFIIYNSGVLSIYASSTEIGVGD